MQPFPSELEPPEADRALENIAAGTDNDSPVIDRYLQPVSPAPQPHQFERGITVNAGAADDAAARPFAQVGAENGPK